MDGQARQAIGAATRAGIPWLAVGPDIEAAEIAEIAPGTVTLRPGDSGSVPAGFNILEPATGPGGERFSLQKHVGLLRSLFHASGSGYDPFPIMLMRALGICFAKAGWDPSTWKPADPEAIRAWPQLGDLQAAAWKVAEPAQPYAHVPTPATSDADRRLVSDRIGRLVDGPAGSFLDAPHPLDLSRLLLGNLAVDTGLVAHEDDQAFLAGALLLLLEEHHQLHNPSSAERPGPSPFRHVTVLTGARCLGRMPPPDPGPEDQRDLWHHDPYGAERAAAERISETQATLDR